MFGLIGLAIAFGVSWFGYSTARRFVRERLRYVDAALTPLAAIAAGLGAAIVAGLVLTPVSWIPLVGAVVGKFVSGGTVLVFGIGTGLGARAGASDVKHGYRITGG